MFLVAVILVQITSSHQRDVLSTIECDEDPVGYILPDPDRCDRYLDCDPTSGRQVLFCPDGTALQLSTGECTDVENAACGERKLPRKNLLSSRHPLKSRKINRGNIPKSRGTKSNKIDLESLTCSTTPNGYVIADPVQCDRYASCSPDGEKSISTCPDGLVLDKEQGKCDFPSKVDCQGREKLQESKGKGLCLRDNGNFPLPAEVSCSSYVDCREGEQFVQSCGAGAVFDPILGCVHPDETQRKGCTAADKYEVECPTIGVLGGLHQRFGDHDRIPHPGGDCSLFYACLRNGQPRLLGCEKPTVFDPNSGLCEEQENVPGCENTYLIDEEEEEEDTSKIVEAITKQLRKEFKFSSK